MQRFTGLKILTGCLILAHATLAAAQPPGPFRSDGERREFSDGDREDFVRRMRERMEERRSEEDSGNGSREDRERRGFDSSGGRGFGPGSGGGFGDRGDRSGGDRSFGSFGGGGFGDRGFGGGSFRGGFGGGGFGSFGGPGFRPPEFGRGFGAPGSGGSSGEREDRDEQRGFDGGSWPGGFPFRGGRDSEERSSSTPTSSTQRSSSETKKRARVTLSLPAAYAAGDRDGDGQIALYEWRRWKSEQAAIAEFRRLDLNGDGFLTPRELVKASGGSGSSAGSSGVQIATTQSGGAERSREGRRRGR